MLYNSKDDRKDYFPPLLGNGDIVLSPDCEGSVYYDQNDYPDVSAHTGRIFRAGRRCSFTHDQPHHAPLLFWGGIKFNYNDKVKSFTQELNVNDGVVTSECEYNNGISIKTECFVHQEYNLYAIKKTFKGSAGKVGFTFSLDDSFFDETLSVSFTKKTDTVLIDAQIKAYDTYRAQIALITNKVAKIDVSDKKATFSYEVCDGDELCFYYILEDSLFCDNYEEKIKNIIENVFNTGFSGLFSENKQIWNSYHEQGHIKTENELINSIYSTAMYHLKCYTTQWSIPVGLNDLSWHGKYFAFDEFYAFLALLQSNKTDLAKRVPTFRLNKCFDKAIKRATDYSQNPDVNQARFVWEADENGEELAPYGFWLDHIFHIAAIEIGAFEYYEHTNDTAFLKECYPMIKGCAKFYTLNSIYENTDGSLIIGKCTDLERLGSCVLNPFFTSCGVIKTLEVLAKSADILNVDADYRMECECKAKKLRETLAHDEEKYVPFSGCTQKSIAVFSGKYPFDVIANNDPKLLPALLDFVQNENKYGNMYPAGKKVSLWYSSWKAVAFARMKMADYAYTALLQSTESVGSFTEAFEINEENQIMRPWFSTAAGVFSSALNEMLLQSDGENIYLLPAAPEEFSTVSFKLSAKGGAIVDAEIKNNEIKKLDITFKSTATPKKFNIFFRNRKIIKGV